MSGYTENAMLNHGRVAQGANVLQKPFSKRDLAATVRQLLDEDFAVPLDVEDV